MIHSVKLFPVIFPGRLRTRTVEEKRRYREQTADTDACEICSRNRVLAEPCAQLLTAYKTFQIPFVSMLMGLAKYFINRRRTLPPRFPVSTSKD